MEKIADIKAVRDGSMLCFIAIIAIAIIMKYS